MFFTDNETLQWACVFAVFILFLLCGIPVSIAERRQGGRENRNPRAQQLVPAPLFKRMW
jgi:uncharacterized MAPEG superfamily protein